MHGLPLPSPSHTHTHTHTQSICAELTKIRVENHWCLGR